MLHSTFEIWFKKSAKQHGTYCAKKYEHIRNSRSGIHPLPLAMDVTKMVSRRVDCG